MQAAIDARAGIARDTSLQPALRASLVEAVSASGRRDAAAWLALLRHDYGLAKGADTPELWARLSAAFRSAAVLPPDQRRTEAHALLQLDEARVKMRLRSDDARPFLKVARTVPQGRNRWPLWRCSVIHEAQQGART